MNDPADNHGVSLDVPCELWLSVFVGAVGETEAIAGGRRAAAVESEEERRAILFGPAIPTPASEDHRSWCPVGPPPWQEP